MDPILQGWLVKSPPEWKTQGFRKLFKAKWRRRYFVLYEPPAAESLPGTRAALDYYHNETRQKKIGDIDLNHCDEVQTRLDTSLYKHVFSLKTKHRGKDRTYYLATESETEMTKWVDCLCLALGLKESDDTPTAHIESATVPLPAQSSPVGNQRVNTALGYGSPTLNNPTPDQSLSRRGLPHAQQNQYQPQLQNQQYQHQQHQQSQEQYIDLSECTSGDTAVQLAPMIHNDRQRHSNEPDILEQVPPAPHYADHRESIDSIPPELAPSPPCKQGSRQWHDGEPSMDTYDKPPRYYDNVDDNENVYKMPRGEGEEGIYKVPRPQYEMETNELYQVPPTHYPQQVRNSVGSTDRDSLYQVPPPHPREVSVTDSLYQVPPSRHHFLPVLGEESPPAAAAKSLTLVADDVYDVPPSAKSRTNPNGSMRDSNSSSDSRSSHAPADSGFGSAGDVYDHPKRHLAEKGGTITRGSAQETYSHSTNKSIPDNNILEKVVPAPQKVGHFAEEGEKGYMNISPNHPVNPDFSSSSRASSCVQPSAEDLYDVPPSHDLDDMQKLGLTPPPPCSAPKIHSYVNALASMASADDVYVPMKHPPQQQQQSRVAELQPTVCDKPGAPMYMPMSSPPPACGGPMYTPMGATARTESLYTVPPSNRPVNPTVHDHVPPPLMHRNLRTASQISVDPHPPSVDYTIFPTHRTRSFKRNIQTDVKTASPRGATSEVVLPTRTGGYSGSSDDDTDTCSTTDRSMESLHLPPKTPPAKSASRHPHQAFRHAIPTTTDKLIHSQKGALNCTPPPPPRSDPPRPDEVKYIDLDLDESSDPEKSPVFARSPSHGHSSATDYKEIDFVKTKALSEMKKDLENKRKSSERSVDE